MTDTAQPTSERKSAKPRNGLRARRIIGFLVASVATLAACLIIAFWVVTRSWFIIDRVQPELERKLGGPVAIESAEYLGSGRFGFNGITLRSPEHRGTPGELLRIGRAEVTVNLKDLLRADVTLLAVDLTDVLMRISEHSRHASEFTFMSLDPQWDEDDDDKKALPPRIRFHNAIVEFGLYDGARYERQGARRLGGEMRPTGEETGEYSIELRELSVRGRELGAEGLSIVGAWNALTQAFEATLHNLRFDERTQMLCPAVARLWWERMDPEGEIASAHVQWSPEQSLQIDVQVQNIALTLPVETEEVWSQYRDGQVEPTPAQPRMWFDSGTITLAGDTFKLDQMRGVFGVEGAAGNVIGVPHTLTLSLPTLPAFDWSERESWGDLLLRATPFEMDLNIEGFRFGGEGEQALQAMVLPTQVARALERFRMTRWVLSANVKVWRDPPATQLTGLVPRPIQSQGQAYITDAAGAFEKFPYPLRDVSAFLRFTRDEVRLEYLTGYGEGKSRMRLSGTIAPPSKHPGIEMRLTAHDILVDETFRAALSGSRQKAYDNLLDAASYERALLAGPIFPENRAELEGERQAVLARMTDAMNAEVEGPVLSSDSNLIEGWRREAQRLQRLAEMRPFEPGGTLSLDLRIRRAEGQGQRTTLTGDISVHDAGIIYEKFPYPLAITEGKLTLYEDRLEITEEPGRPGLRLFTPGGGTGWATGEILFPRDEEGKLDVRPNLHFRVVDDRVNPQLFVAIPAEDHADDEDDDDSHHKGDGAAAREALGESAAATARQSARADNASMPTLSRAGATLRSLGVQGDLSYVGDVKTSEDGRTTFDFVVEIRDGIAHPHDDFGAMVGTPELRWPHDFVIDDLTALMRITPDAVTLATLTGAPPTGTMAADGRIDLTPAGDVLLDVRFDEVALRESLLRFLPAALDVQSHDLWANLHPEGSFDAVLEYRAQRGREKDGDDDVSGEAEADAPMSADAGTSLIVHPREVSLSLEGERVRLAREEGLVRVTRDGIELIDLALSMNDGRRTRSTITLAGDVPFDARESGELHGRWSNGDFASPLVPSMMRLLGAAPQADQYVARHPLGRFDATFSSQTGAAEGRRAYELVLLPQTASFSLNDVIVAATFGEQSEIIIHPQRITLRDVHASHLGGDVSLEGVVDFSSERTAVDLRIEYGGSLRNEQLQAFLPDVVRRALNAIEWDDHGGSSLTNGRLEMQQTAATLAPDAPLEWIVSFSGDLSTRDATLNVGAPIRDLTGSFAIKTHRHPGNHAQLRIDAQAETLIMFEQDVTNATAQLVLSDDGMSILVNDFRGDMYGGAVTGRATVGVGENVNYVAEAEVAGVKLAGFAREDDPRMLYGRSRTTLVGAPPITAAPMPEPGLAYGYIALEGRRGELHSRTGRGAVRIVDGNLAGTPLSLALLQLIELMPPLSGRLDFGDASFFVEGEQLIFERVSLEAPTLQLVGDGTLNLESMALDLTLRSRGTFSLYREVVSGFSDRLFGIHVTGTLRAPEARAVALPKDDGAPGENLSQPLHYTRVNHADR